MKKIKDLTIEDFEIEGTTIIRGSMENQMIYCSLVKGKAFNVTTSHYMIIERVNCRFLCTYLSL